ncbi:DNA topoisomerase IB, partial [Alcanivoracaceae bacterium MT1]
PRADGHLQAVGVDEAGRTQYRYHEEWSRRASAEKFDRALRLADVLPRVRAGVTRDLRGDGLSRARVLAGAFRLIDEALLRVGGERYARERGTVGLATLRVRHVEISGSVVTLAFPGKSGERWERAIDDPDLAALVAELTDRGPRSHLLSWRDDDGWHPLRSAGITADVRERAGLDATAKDLRTLRGTAIAARSLAKAGPAHTDAERRSALAQAARDAADALGNTPSVARSSYIDPRVADRFERGAVVDPGSLAHVERQLPGFLG